MDEIKPNIEGFEQESPLFGNAEQEAGRQPEQDIPETLDGEQTQEETPVKEEKSESVEAGPQEVAKKRHRSTKAEMEAKRRAAAAQAGENPDEEKNQTQQNGGSDAEDVRDISLMEAVFRMGMELSCPKTRDQVDAGNGRQWPYRTVEDILCALKPLMMKYGVFVTFTTRIDCIGELNYVVVEATARNLRGETFSTTSYAREDFARPGNWAAQITGSCESYAKKYALQSMFMIDNTKLEPVEDPDATSDKAPLQPAAAKNAASAQAHGQKEELRSALKPLLVRGCGDWMTRAADAANWTGTREEYAQKVRKNYRISEDDLLILLSAVPEGNGK